MNMFIFNLALKIIEFFTIFKMYMNNIKQNYDIYIYPKLDNIISIFVPKYNTEYIKNNETISTCLINKENDNINSGSFDNNFADFTIYCDDNNNMKINHNTHVTNKNYICDKSSIYFFTFTLKYNNISYDLNLNKPNNFLIVDNNLDHLFFYWYMQKYHNIYINNQYTINCIDKNFIEHVIKCDEIINISKDEITIINHSKKNI
jgi:hypothetical protein